MSRCSHSLYNPKCESCKETWGMVKDHNHADIDFSHVEDSTHYQSSHIDLKRDGSISFTVPADVAVKHDDSKVRMDLLSVIAMTEIAKVMTFGAKKYDDHNWRKGFKWSRLLGAVLRHIFAFIGGQDKDPETGLSHLAHAGCCILFLLEHEETHKDKDDRYKKESV